MRLVRAYHDKLYKEYALTDFRLTAAGSDKLALRWRTENEVISSKGQFICANIPCKQVLDLVSWQVDFRYFEAEIAKAALVKLRLCPDCSKLLPRTSRAKYPENKSSTNILP
jgi:protein FRA10AC1